MTLHYKTEGFVFKKEDLLEADRIFSVFTKDFGRIEVLGKAIRKITSKLRGGIETFSLSEVEFIQGGSKKTLTGAVFLEKFISIKQTPEKFEIACRISNVLDEFIKGEEKDEKIWNLTIDVFEKLNHLQSSNINYRVIYFYFFWNFISILGYGLQLSKCTVCNGELNPYSLYLSNREGGVLCQNCFLSKRDRLKIDSGILKILRLILKREWDILSRLKIENKMQKSLEGISNQYLKSIANN